MKKRSLSKMIFLSVVTLGLYEIYWLASTRNEMVNKFGANIPDALLMIVLRGFLIIAFAVVVVIVLLAGTKDDAAWYVLAAFLIIPTMAIADWLYLRRWIVPYANAVELVTHKKLKATVVTLSLARIVPFVGPVLLQRSYNQI